MADADPGGEPLGILTIDRPEQLKALGHPLRLRVLELLGENDELLTNRELAQRLEVDPGHLHFHVRTLLKAELIQRVEGGHGREKPYRAVANTIRVAPELLTSPGATSDVHAAILDEVNAGWAKFAAREVPQRAGDRADRTRARAGDLGGRLRARRRARGTARTRS